MKKKIAKNAAAGLVIVLTICLAYICATYIGGGAGAVENIAATLPNLKTFSRLNKSLLTTTTETLDVTPQLPVGPLGQCISWASETYHVPPAALAGIMHVEGGRVGQGVHNSNGSYDLGLMQVNSIWIPQLARLWHVDYATAYKAIRDNGCENVYIGAWILKQKIAETGTLYNGISYYHSATPRLGSAYANKVIDSMPRDPQAVSH